MAALILKISVIYCGLFAFVKAVQIGVATDPVSFDPAPRPQEEAFNEDSRPSEEISSPGHVILPEEHYENQPEIIDQATDVQVNNPGLTTTTASPSNGDLDAFILNWFRTDMNESRYGDFTEDEIRERPFSSNCSDLSCLHGFDTTTPSGDQTENGTASEEYSTAFEETVKPTIHSNMTRRRTEDSTTTSGSFTKSENTDSKEKPLSSRGPTSQHRLLFLSSLAILGSPIQHDIREILEDPENEEVEGKGEMIGNANSKRKTVQGTKSHRSGFNVEIMMDKEQLSRLLPGKSYLYETMINMNVPDAIQSLKKCGIFPACSLTVYPPSQDMNNENLGKRHLQRDEETDLPLFVKKSVDVNCEPTSVSMMASFTIILAVIIIVSNAIIIIVTLRTKTLRKPHGYFKISLAIADLLNGAFVLTNISSNLIRFIHFSGKDIMQLSQIRREEPNPGEASFFGICAVLSQVVTVYSVLLLSVDSFLSVRWPMQYRVGDLMTTNRAIGLIAIVWTFALGVSALPILAKDYVRYGLSYSTFSYFPVLEPLGTKISEDAAFMARYVHVILYAVLVWGVPFLATWMLTILTAYYSRGMLRSMSMARKKAPHFAKSICRLERDILRTVSIVLAMLTITVLPMMAALVAVSLTADDNPLCIEQPILNLLFAAYYVLVCGSFVNVIVYNACHKEFRRAMFSFLCDVLSWVFSCCFPTFCDLSSFSSAKSFRNKSARGMSRTTFTTDPRKNGNFISRRMKLDQTHSNISNSEKSTTLQSSLPVGMSLSLTGYGRSAVHNCDSIVSDAPSSDRTFSTDTSVSSGRGRSGSSDSDHSLHLTRRQPCHRRSASDSSVFSPSFHDQTQASGI